MTPGVIVGASRSMDSFSSFSYRTTMQPSRVLIVEDDPILLDTVSSTLRLKLPHVQIDTAESVLTSLERIRSVEYAAVLADAQQPRLEGIGFARAVHKIHPECPVLLLV